MTLIFFTTYGNTTVSCFVYCHANTDAKHLIQMSIYLDLVSHMSIA